MVMSLKHSSIMSSISALKVALVSKRESRILLGILLSFVFCLSSLKINVKAENNTSSDNSEIASNFFARMEFYWTTLVDTNSNIMSNTNHLGVESPLLYVNSTDPVYIVYSYYAGQQFPTVVGNGITQNNQVVNGNLIAVRFTGSGSFKIKFSSIVQLFPIFVGGLSQMPNDVRAIIGDNLLLNYVDQINTKLVTSNTRLSDISGYAYSINGNLIDTNTKLDDMYTRMGTTNTHLSNIRSYLTSNNATTNNNVSSNDTAKSNFDTKASSLATFESTQGTNLNTNLQALNIGSSTGLLVNSSFVKSALWVRNMFDRLIVGSPFELVLVFCLSIGIAFAMIGKVK